MKIVKRLVHKSEQFESKCCTVNCATTQSLADEIDAMRDKLNFRSRSEFVYQAILYFIESNRDSNISE
jgi:metal-responsive CopG/Arc/MetJ family transcriptional regulator